MYEIDCFLRHVSTDLSNEGSNFILSPLEVGHLDSEFAQFSSGALLMSKLTKLLALACLKKYFLKVF